MSGGQKYKCTQGMCMRDPDGTMDLLDCLLQCDLGSAVCETIGELTTGFIGPCDPNYCDVVDQCKKYGVSLEKKHFFACCRRPNKTALIVGATVGGVAVLLLIACVLVSLRSVSSKHVAGASGEAGGSISSVAMRTPSV